jgi:hypothetical protein
MELPVQLFEHRQPSPGSNALFGWVQPKGQHGSAVGIFKYIVFNLLRSRPPGQPCITRSSGGPVQPAVVVFGQASRTRPRLERLVAWGRFAFREEPEAGFYCSF